MAFDKELAILYGFFHVKNLKKKLTLNKKNPVRGPKIFFFFFFFFFLNFSLILYQNAYNFLQNCHILCFNSI